MLYGTLWVALQLRRCDECLVGARRQAWVDGFCGVFSGKEGSGARRHSALLLKAKSHPKDCSSMLA